MTRVPSGRNSTTSAGAHPAVDIAWAPLGAGRLALWHRPGRNHFTALRDAGCSHLVTLLSDREGGPTVGDAAKAAGLAWVWLPMPSSDEPTGAARATLELGLADLSSLLDAGHSLLIHCSAGIHRTGMVAYALLRSRGLDRDQALATIGQTRAHTHDGLRARLLQWGDDLAKLTVRR